MKCTKCGKTGDNVGSHPIYLADEDIFLLMNIFDKHKNNYQSFNVFLSRAAVIGARVIEMGKAHEFDKK